METITNLRHLGDGKFKLYTGNLPKNMVADFFYESPTLKMRMYFVKFPLDNPEKGGIMQEKEGE